MSDARRARDAPASLLGPVGGMSPGWHRATPGTLSASAHRVELAIRPHQGGSPGSRAARLSLLTAELLPCGSCLRTSHVAAGEWPGSAKSARTLPHRVAANYCGMKGALNRKNNPAKTGSDGPDVQSDGHRDLRDGLAGSWLPVMISVHPAGFASCRSASILGCGTATAPGARRYRIQTSHSKRSSDEISAQARRPFPYHDRRW